MKAVMFLRTIALTIFSLHITSLVTALPIVSRGTDDDERNSDGESIESYVTELGPDGRPIPEILDPKKASDLADLKLVVDRITFQNLQHKDKKGELGTGKGALGFGFNHWAMIAYTTTGEAVKFEVARGTNKGANTPTTTGTVVGKFRVTVQEYTTDHASIQLIGGKSLKIVPPKAREKITIQDLQDLLIEEQKSPKITINGIQGLIGVKPLQVDGNIQLSNFDYTKLQFTPKTPSGGQGKLTTGISGCKVWCQGVLEVLKEKKFVTKADNEDDFNIVFYDRIEQDRKKVPMGGGRFVHQDAISGGGGSPASNCDSPSPRRRSGTGGTACNPVKAAVGTPPKPPQANAQTKPPASAPAPPVRQANARPPAPASIVHNGKRTASRHSVQ